MPPPAMPRLTRRPRRSSTLRLRLPVFQRILGSRGYVGALPWHKFRRAEKPAAQGAPRAQSSTWETRPSASLGSNQVDLGGMTSLASATAISASMLVG